MGEKMSKLYYSRIEDRTTLNSAHFHIRCHLSEIESVLSVTAKDNDFVLSVFKDSLNGNYFVCERIENGLISALKNRVILINEFYCLGTVRTPLNWLDGIMMHNLGSPEQSSVYDLYDYLMSINQAGKLTIYYYPQRPDTIPQDDQDLIDRAIIQFRLYGSTILNDLLQFHPHLFERVINGIKSENFKEYSI